MNVFSNLKLKTLEEQKTKKKSNKQREQELILAFNEARKEGNKQLESYYFEELTKIVDKTFNTGMRISNYDALYPGYSQEFFSELHFQLLRRISDYEDGLNEMSTKKKPWNKLGSNWKDKEEKDKKFNIKSMAIALGKYVHEELIYKYNDKTVSRKEMRWQFRDGSFVGMNNSLYTNISNASGDEKENLLSDIGNVWATYGVGDSSLDNLKMNNNIMLYDFLIQYIEKKKFSLTEDRTIFSTMSKSNILDELKNNHMSHNTIKTFNKMSKVFPDFKLQVQNFF